MATGADGLLADGVRRRASWLGDASTVTKRLGDGEFVETVRGILGAPR